MGTMKNVLWICADDLAIDVIGCYGGRVARTPNIDRLAAEGLTFDAAFANAPLSTPSRQAFWTGRHPRSIGVTRTPTPLPREERTLPELLREKGVFTASFGKTHYYAPRTWDYDRCVNHKDHQHWIDKNDWCPPVETGGPVLGPWRPFVDPGRIWLNADCLPCHAEDEAMLDTFYARRAAAFLVNDLPADLPAFTYVSFSANHSPFRFPIEFRDRVRPDGIDVPDVPPVERALLPPVFAELSEADIRGIIAAHCTATEHLDKNIGLVLDALEQSGQAEDTLVIFTTDHGYMLGEHGRFEKHCLYEQAIRTALILRHDSLSRGARSSALVQLFDLMPFILQRFNVEVPLNVQARQDFEQIVHRPDSEFRDHVFIEHAESAEACVRTRTHKLCFRGSNWMRMDGYAGQRSPPLRVQLFDLAVDPNEHRDLACDPAHKALRDDLLERLYQHLIETLRFPHFADPQGQSKLAHLSQLVRPAEWLGSVRGGL